MRCCVSDAELLSHLHRPLLPARGKRIGKLPGQDARGAPVGRAQRANVVTRSRAVRQCLDKVSSVKTNIDLLWRGTVVRCGRARACATATEMPRSRAANFRSPRWRRRCAVGAVTQRALPAEDREGASLSGGTSTPSGETNEPWPPECDTPWRASVIFAARRAPTPRVQ